MRWHRSQTFVFAAVVLSPAAALAYVGPGAGFALISSFLTIAIAFVAAFFAFLTLPVRVAVRTWRRRRSLKRARVKKTIVLGLDGLEPSICDHLLERGLLPNLAKLRATGTYRRLGTSMPALSPVAWSTFATGTDPSRHGIYDFIARDPRTYAPKLSSSEVYGQTRFLHIGPFRIPRGGSGVRGLRKSRTFWSILTDHGVFSSVLRVPITDVKTTPAPDGPPGHVIRAQVVVDAGWVRDAILSNKNLFNYQAALVEVEVRGDFILDCNGQAVDADPVGLSPAPTGNGAPGGRYLSSFRVAARRGQPPVNDPYVQRTQGGVS